MRDDCKYFQIRAYASGEVARFCALDLAPEAPWRCPEHCPRYSKRNAGSPLLTDVSVAQGREPDLHPDAVSVLSSAEEIITAVGPEIAAERRRLALEEERRSRTWWNRLRQRSARWRR